MSQLTEEQNKDIAERIEKFKAAHKALVEEYQVDETSEPHCIPTGPYTYGIAIGMTYVDLKYRVPSPIQNEPSSENKEPS